MKILNNKTVILSTLVISLTGCGSWDKPPKSTDVPIDTVIEQPTVPVIIDQEPVVEIPVVVLPTEPEIIVQEPVILIPPKTPIFYPDGITTGNQQPYEGKIIRGGDTWLNYNSEFEYFNNFELPEFTVTYKYEPLLEILITDGNEDLCIRYSWKTGKFGIAKPVCLWSSVNDGMELPDLHQAYYGYRVTGTRVWFNGVAGLGVEVD